MRRARCGSCMPREEEQKNGDTLTERVIAMNRKLKQIRE